MNPFLTKIFYLRSFGKFKSSGRNISLSRHGKFIRPEEISFGSNIYINSSFHISARNLTFGSNIMIGPNLVIECDNHVFDRIGTTMFSNRNTRNIGFVKVENDVWIGANVVILPNVTIREGSVIGAGSVVTKSLPPYSVCVGNPCKPIKSRFNRCQLTEHLLKINSDLAFETIILELQKFGINI